MTILIIFVVLLGVGLYLLDKKPEYGLLCAISGIVLFFLLFANAISYMSDICSLKRYNTGIGTEKLLINQRDDILQAIKEEATKYMIYEQSTFEKLKPENVQMLLINYPQLNSSWIIKDNIEKIAYYNSKIYGCKENMIRDKQDILSNRYNIFMFYLFNLDY